MSLKRVLGMMLASRMAGRGMAGRGGAGSGLGGLGGLGTAAMLGGLGRRGMGGKMGLAALGYMAYRSYRDSQASAVGNPAGAGGAGAAGGLGGLGGMLREVADRVTGGAISGGQAGAGAHGATPEGSAEIRDGERAAASFSDDKALLLIRAMITAAYSDGALSEAERARIMRAIDDAGGDAEDRHVLEREIANPRPADELLSQVHDHDTAEAFYLASRASIGGDSAESQAYLASLRQRLKLSSADVAEVEEIASGGSAAS